ncbi:MULTISPECIES: FadR/GntR family transcriptional regulator [Leucobacter]|uniref:FadR/GntR family transcriptional regulator n=1 Tax=Leucobacter TaxID=55968 RepID=UPI000E65DE12|nr:FCD domain-containing protein [Leucobacter aridicollis]UTX53943.1 FadR family transcriptional regulator [Leucobacter aridicollis]
MAQVQRSSLADQAADVLLNRIRAGEWELGAKLPGETTLAPQLGVGRSTAREAIRQLAGLGVLTSRQGAGVFVTALDVRDDWDLVLRRSDILAVIEARTAIEAESAELAAHRRTPADLRAIRRTLDARAEQRDDIAAHVDADTAFHRAVVQAAGNPILLELFDGFTPRIRPAMIEMLRLRGSFGSNDFSGSQDHDHHVDLADAIAARDAARAASVARAHLRSLGDALTSPGSDSGSRTTPAQPTSSPAAGL